MFRIRIFATDRNLEEENGKVLQALFQQNEIFEFEVLGLYPRVVNKGEIQKGLDGNFFEFIFYQKELEIQIKPIYFDQKFDLIQKIGKIIKSKRKYITTRWPGLNESEKYPLSIPNQTDYAVRFVIDGEIDYNIEQGWLFITIRGILNDFNL